MGKRRKKSIENVVVRASEEEFATKKELVDAIKTYAFDRPVGKNSVGITVISESEAQKEVKSEPKLVKTPFGEGYFLDEIDGKRFKAKKFSLYQGRAFVLKGDLEEPT